MTFHHLLLSSSQSEHAGFPPPGGAATLEHCPRVSLKRERKKLSPSPSLYSSVAVLKPQDPSKEPQQLSRQPVPMLGHQHSEDVFWWSGEAPVLCFVLFLGTIWQSLTLFLPSVPRQVGSPGPVPLPQAEQPWLPAVLADAPALCSASRPFGLCLCARLPGAGGLGLELVLELCPCVEQDRQVLHSPSAVCLRSLASQHLEREAAGWHCSERSLNCVGT